MNSRDVIKALQRDGWHEVNQVGSHKQFKHATKEGRVTVPHPKRNIPLGNLKSQAEMIPGGKEFQPWTTSRICIKIRIPASA